LSFHRVTFCDRSRRSGRESPPQGGDHGTHSGSNSRTDPTEQRHVRPRVAFALAAAKDFGPHGAAGGAGEGSSQNGMPADPTSLRLSLCGGRAALIAHEQGGFVRDRSAQRRRMSPRRELLRTEPRRTH